MWTRWLKPWITAYPDLLHLFLFSQIVRSIGIFLYFEKTYIVILGQSPWTVKRGSLWNLEFWNHFARIVKDREFPQTSNMVESFHRGFKTRVHRPKPSVQENVRAIKKRQNITDFHIDRLIGGKTPCKKRKICDDLCCLYSTFSSKMEYLFAIAKLEGRDIE